MWLIVQNVIAFLSCVYVIFPGHNARTQYAYAILLLASDAEPLIMTLDDL